MAAELSQGELLDFLCGAGGRVANGALLGHFRRFLRDPGASPERLQRRRERFKGFVNAVATVQQERPGAPKFVVLRKRYRELVADEPQPRHAPAQQPAGRGQAPRPPARGALLGGAARGRHDGWARPPEQPRGAPGPAGGPQQRVREWVARATEAALQAAAGPSAPRACPSPPPDGQPAGREAWRDPVPVFRSIRCRLSLQDLDGFLEQESEDSSSASGGSDSCRGEGESGAQRRPSAGGAKNPPSVVGWTGAEGLSNGLGGPSAKASGPPRGSAVPGRLALPGQIARGSSSDELSEKDCKRPNGHMPEPGKVARLPPPNLDAPLSPQLVLRQRHPGSTMAAEGPGPDAEESPEHRSSLVPLEPREHAWLVKVASGSWLQARALFLEDPHLATHKDFISGYTVLHWLAKHGNAQVLLDFVTGARKAGVDLDVNVKSGCGYTPLHLAAMHGHQLVIRLLVQTLHCRVQVRDGSGKKPWQYLSSSTSGEIWQLLGAPKGKTIFPAHPIARNSSPARRGRSPELARKISRKTSLAAYLKPQHIKWKMANKYPALQEREEDSD